LFQSAQWDQRYTKSVSVPWRRGDSKEWVCASSGGGTEVCVPPEQAKIENASRSIVFICRFGTGGTLTNFAVTRDSNSLYCDKQA
jgi:hypothetical protein